MMGQDGFRLPNRIHDIGSLVVQTKQWSSKPSVEDLWMAYLARIPMERTREEIHALQSWFYQEIEEQGYELLLM
ncbi:hypothetical protein ACTG2N_18700 [Aeromonas hydrophila]|uniref:hypothetical protein n=1 Tax=Aeromonas hydrophila TaxID=644 RepID=UPI00256F63DF|nr:hypothetical protein [Aeromonas hydrophila]MDL5386679.1 hypothetical protein [Aeromonas hydrophila]